MKAEQATLIIIHKTHQVYLHLRRPSIFKDTVATGISSHQRQQRFKAFVFWKLVSPAGFFKTHENFRTMTSGNLSNTMRNKKIAAKHSCSSTNLWFFQLRSSWSSESDPCLNESFLQEFLQNLCILLSRYLILLTLAAELSRKFLLRSKPKLN